MLCSPDNLCHTAKVFDAQVSWELFSVQWLAVAELWKYSGNIVMCDTAKNSSITTKHLYLILTFRSHHEIFIRRNWYSVLPSLDATISCRIKKAVVGVTQLITALVSIHSSMTFPADMYSFLDPPCRTVLFSVDDRSLFPAIGKRLRSSTENKTVLPGGSRKLYISAGKVIELWIETSSYQLSHVYDRFLDATADRRIKTRKNWVPASSDEDQNKV